MSDQESNNENETEFFSKDEPDDFSTAEDRSDTDRLGAFTALGQNYGANAEILKILDTADVYAANAVVKHGVAKVALVTSLITTLGSAAALAVQSYNVKKHS